LKKVLQRDWTPIVILGILALTFGWMLPKLGFYQDDWAMAFDNLAKGPQGTYYYHLYDSRPGREWYMNLLFLLVGHKPLGWQVYGLLMRFLTVLFAWMSFRQIWPNSKAVISAAACLFAVYPVFTQQALPLTYSLHWISYPLFFLSLFLMIRAVRSTRNRWLLMILSIAADGLSVLFNEFFIGLELIRFPILWFLLSDERDGRAQKSFLMFLPYGMILSAFFLWRLFLVQLPGTDRLDMSLLSELRSAPLPTLVSLAQTAGQDIIEVLLSSWSKTIRPDVFAFDRLHLAALGVAVILLVLVALGLTSITRSEESSKATSTQDANQIFLIGALIVILGLLPGWAIGRSVSDFSILWPDRFGLASMSGAALIIAQLLALVLRSQRVWVFFMAVLVAASGAWHVRNLNYNRLSWTTQQRAYNQLLWRMPDMQEGTIFISEVPIMPNMGEYPTAYAINSLYEQNTDPFNAKSWYSSLSKNYKTGLPGPEEDQNIHWQHKQIRFDSSLHAMVALEYQHSDSRCLWVLKPSDKHNPYLSPADVDIALRSNLDQILGVSPAGYPRWDILGQEAPHDWCYYYQKADLAWQFEDWDKITALWAESEPYRKGINAWTELSPFLIGALKTGDIEEAKSISSQILNEREGFKPYLCDIGAAGLDGNDKINPADAALVLTDLECALR